MGLISQSHHRQAMFLVLLAAVTAAGGASSGGSTSAAPRDESQEPAVSTDLYGRLFAATDTTPVASLKRQATNSLRKRLFAAATVSPRATRDPNRAADLRGRLFVATTGFSEPTLTTLLVAAPPVKHIAAAVPPESADALDAAEDETPGVLGDEQGLRRLPPVQFAEARTVDDLTHGEPEPPAIEFGEESPNRYSDDGPGATLATTPETMESTVPSPPEDEISFLPQIDSPHSELPAAAIAISGPERNALDQIDIVQEPTSAASSPIAIESNRPSEPPEAETPIVQFADAPRADAKRTSPKQMHHDREESPTLAKPLEILVAADPFAAAPSTNSLRSDPQASHGGGRHEHGPLEIAVAPRQDEVAFSRQGEPEPTPALPRAQDEIAFAEESGQTDVVRLPPTEVIADAAPPAAEPVAVAPVPQFEVPLAEPTPAPIDRDPPPPIASSPLPIERATPQVEHPTPMPPLEAQPTVELAGPVQPSRQRPGVEGLLLHATEARHHVQQGFGAANRGMLYTARKEFMSALQIVAEAKDAAKGRRAHMDALAAGLAAVEEAEKIRDASTAVASINLSMLVATHRTPVLKGQDVSEMLPLAAIDKYHEYAQQQLADAVAGDPSGSMALYGLARIYEHLGTENGADRVARSRQSVAFHEAALLACPDNYLAAHELGVVLARLGRNEKAMEMLTRSVQLSPTSVAYRNLAVVSRQIGQNQAATVAEQYAEQVARHEEAAGEGASRVALVDPAEFARTSDRHGMTQPLTGAIPPAMPAADERASPQTVGRPPESGETIVERLAAPLKALSPQSWLGTSRN